MNIQYFLLQIIFTFKNRKELDFLIDLNYCIKVKKQHVIKNVFLKCSGVSLINDLNVLLFSKLYRSHKVQILHNNSNNKEILLLIILKC